MHVIVDAEYGGRPLDEQQLMLLAGGLTAHIGMTPMGEPLYVGGMHPWGPSLIIPWQESHASVHYMPPPTLAVDLFSCKAFDDRAALVWLWERLFLVRLLNYRLIPRFFDRFQAS